MISGFLSVAAADTYSSRTDQTDQSDSVSSTTFVDTVDLDRLDTVGGRYICRYEEHYYDGVGESVLTIEAAEADAEAAEADAEADPEADAEADPEADAEAAEAVEAAETAEADVEGYRAVWEGITDVSEIIADKHMRTQQLVYTKTDTDTELHVERSGNQLIVSGFDAGEPVDEELELGSDRWFQLLPFSLIPVTTAFSGSSAVSDSSEESVELEDVEFSMFDPFNIKVRNLRVIKQGKETVTVKGVEYDAMKLAVRLQGFMSLFWKSEVWNDAATGTYIKYEGLNVEPEWYKSQIFLKSIEYQR